MQFRSPRFLRGNKKQQDFSSKTLYRWMDETLDEVGPEATVDFTVKVLQHERDDRHFFHATATRYDK